MQHTCAQYNKRQLQTILLITCDRPAFLRCFFMSNESVTRIFMRLLDLVGKLVMCEKQKLKERYGQLFRRKKQQLYAQVNDVISH